MEGFIDGLVPFIRDMDCRADTPIIHGGPCASVYGKGIPIYPGLPGRRDTAHMQEVYLQSLPPLEYYDKVIVLLSGGKDSIATYLKMLELGVPKEKIEFWHHDIDGGSDRRMDWPCTKNYVKAIAEAEQIPLRVSYRENGFFGELYRLGASEPVCWEDPDTGEVFQCAETKAQKECREIKERSLPEMEEQLKQFGYRMKFPAKAGDLSRRWCSAYLKIMVASSVMACLDAEGELVQRGGKRMKFPAKGTTFQGRWCSGALKMQVASNVMTHCEEMQERRILVVSGERRGESTGRSKLNEMEVHRNNTKTSGRIVHAWRPVIDYTERDVWEVLKRHHINPHPCYRAGWNRCSCSMCVFSTPELFAGIRELYPEDFEKLCEDEKVLGFTLDNKKSLEDFVGNARSCVYHGDAQAIKSLLSGAFTKEEVYVDDWTFPAGAFHGAEGGPC